MGRLIYSSTLEAPRSSRTRIERRFDPVKVGELKASLGHDISIGGPTLAANAFQVGLVDDCHLFLNPIIVGAGTPALPAGVRQQLTLVSDRRFGNGVVHLHYRTTARPTR